jgi:hypothetical protein
MKIIRFIIWFALFGLLIPLSFQTIWWLIDRYQFYNLRLELGIQKVMLVLWPSSIMMMPAGSDERYFIVAIIVSTVINIVFYTSIGVAVWYGIKKHYSILLLPCIVILAIAWKMLTL